MVLRYLYKSRDLADKESEKLIRACELEAYALSMVELDNPDQEMLVQTLRSNLTTHLDSLPFELIQEDVERRKGRADLFSENLLM